MVDLSFTHDSNWRKEREKTWAPREVRLKSNFRKREIDVFRHYYFNGELPESGFTIGDLNRFSLYPLHTPDGWNYILASLIDSSEYHDFAEIVKYSTQSWLDKGYSLQEELALFDYFFGKAYSPVIKSRVPMGRDKKYQELALSADYMFWRGLQMICCWLDGKEEDPTCAWAYRLDYLFGLVELVDPRTFDLYVYSRKIKTETGELIRPTQNFLRRILAFMEHYELPSTIEDPNHERENCLKEFRERLEALQKLPGQLAEVWAEVRAESH